MRSSMLLILAALSATGCGRPDAQRLRLTGSSTVAPLAAEIARRYEATHPGVRIDVETGGSARGVEDARAGRAEIGMVSRALKPDEHDLHAYTIAQDGIAIIVHRDNPVRELTEAEIIGLYTGHWKNWSDVGGADGGVIVVSKAEGRSTLELFLAHFRLQADQLRPDVVIGDNEQGIKTVAGDPRAIGYVSVGAAEASAAAGVPIRLLPLAGVPASRDAVRRGVFPISRPLNLVTRGAATGLAHDFIAYAGSEEVHDLVDDLAFVPAR